MNKKIIAATVAGATAGIAIYLIAKALMEQKKVLKKRDAELRKKKPKSVYAYEYTL